MASGIFYPAASTDDGYIYTANSTLDLVHVGFGGSYSSAFIRFTNVTIPKGATINSAFLRFKNEMSRVWDTCNVNIKFEDEDDPGTITTFADFGSRSRTSAVAWNAIGHWETDASYDSPDLASILQTIVNRNGWVSGQHIIAFIDNNGSTPDGYRSGYDYTDNPSYVVGLHVTWTEQPQGDFDLAPLVFTISGSLDEPQDLDFTSDPLSFQLSESLDEPQNIDFSSDPLDFITSLVHAHVNLYFENDPLEFDTSLSLSESCDIGMSTAPLEFVVTFDQNFEGRGSNFIRVNLPLLTMTSELVERNLRTVFDLPNLTMEANLLVGEVLYVDVPLPVLGIKSGLNVGLLLRSIADLSFNLKYRSTLATGVLLSIASELPALEIESHSYQTPKIHIVATLPAMYSFATLRTHPKKKVYRATVINLKNMAVTKYNNYDFNSLCFFNGVYLGANENGIFVLGGKLVNKETIEWNFTTPKMDLLNIIPMDVWLALRNENDIILKVIQNEDEAHPYYYTVNADTDPKIHMERAKLGRGLDARTIQIEVSGSGEFDLSKLAIVSHPSRKSKR